jgi:hypothetical protein
MPRNGLPAVGNVAPERTRAERQRWFRRGFRFQAGTLGADQRAATLLRLGRCRDHGEDGLGRGIGRGIVAGNLERMAPTIVPASGAIRGISAKLDFATF